MTPAFDADEKYKEERLDRDHQPKKLFTYYALCLGHFPYDMLRFEGCWPATSEDAAKIEAAAHGHRDGRYTVKLLSYREPTPARWTSFNCPISAEPGKF